MRPFDGDSEQAARFAVHCWESTYAGRSYYPVWDADYMERQLFAPGVAAGICRLGAYRGGRLVGFLAAEKMRFCTPDGERTGTMSSWLSVDPAERGAGIGGALRSAMWEWQRAQGCAFMLGFVDAARAKGEGRRFWTSQVEGASLRPRPALWLHVLDRDAVSAAAFSRQEAIGFSLLARLQRRSAALREGQLRPYDERDLPAAAELFRMREEQAEFGYSWDQARLGHQLQGHALVLERDGRLEAILAYSILRLEGRRPLICAVIDFVAARPEARARRAELISASLGRLARERGVHAGMMLGPPVHETALLLAGGFMPMPSQQALIHLPVCPSARMPQRPHRLHLHWR